jgi:hypothetical protein
MALSHGFCSLCWIFESFPVRRLLYELYPLSIFFAASSPDPFYFLSFIDTPNSYFLSYHFNHICCYRPPLIYSLLQLPSFTYVKLMWRYSNKVSNERVKVQVTEQAKGHVKEHVKEQLKLKIGLPQPEVTMSQQSLIDLASCGYPQPLPRPPLLTIQSSLSPYTLKSPISPRNVDWDSTQRCRSEALGSLPSNLGGSDKELPDIPQTGLAPSIVR